MFDTQNTIGILMEIKDVKQRSEIGRYILSLDSPKICEVGTRLGDFFATLLQPNCSVGIMVDIWTSTGNMFQNDNDYQQEDLTAQYRTVFNRFYSDPRIKIVREFSDVAASFFPDEYFDVVYIDADHSEIECLKDLIAWWPKIKKAGVLCGHDYISGAMTKILGHKVEFGVVEAIERFKALEKANGNSLDVHLTLEQYASYMIKK
jgi:hypothetical protein